jgi:hypothetical protein
MAISKYQVVVSIFGDRDALIKYLATLFLQPRADSIKSAIQGWLDDGYTFAAEDSNGNTVWERIYDTFDQKSIDKFTKRFFPGKEPDEAFDELDMGLFEVGEKLFKKLYKELKATKKSR